MFDLRLLFVAAVWGINFSVVKYALGDFHPLSFTVVRFTLAALFLFAVMRFRGLQVRIERQDRPAVIKLGLLGITLYNIFFMVGLKYTTASHSALLISLSPLIGALIEVSSRREPVRVALVLGLLLAMLGASLIIAGRGPIGFDRSMIVGDMLTLCATVLWALYTVAARPLLRRYSPMTVTAWSVAAGAVLLLPFGVPDIAAQSWSKPSLAAWGALAFAAFIAAGIAYSLWYEGVKRIGVTRTMVYHYLMPFVAVVFAAFFLHERIGLSQIIGGIAIIGGVALVQRGKSSSATDASSCR
jgi:drug/metabolite transporter (DMT)-like permease